MSELRLSSQFELDELEWRVQRSGLYNGNPYGSILCYVTARAIMNRLDNVCGQFNWKDEYQHLPNGVECKLSIYNEHYGIKEWIAKTDGSPETAVESFKGGYSKAFVRAAVKWGIGRYLYYLPATFATFVPKKTGRSTKMKMKEDSKYYFWEPPGEDRQTILMNNAFNKCKIQWKA